MKQVYFFVAFLALCSLPCEAQINAFFEAPSAEYQFYDTEVLVKVTVSSGYQLTSLTASVENKSVNLTAVSSGRYSGTIDIHDLPGDTFLLKVTAKDVQNNIKEISTHIIHNPVPTVVIDTPAYNAVARPFLPLKVTASDDKEVKRIVLVIGGIPSFVYYTRTFYSSSIDTLLDLSEWNGSLKKISVTAYDDYDHGTTASIPVTIESSPYLTEHMTATGMILDYRNDQTVVVDNETYLNPRIADISGSTTAIPVSRMVTNGHGIYNAASLTPYGAILVTQNGSSAPGNAPDSVYDWNQGTIALRQISKNAFYLKTAGNYAIWRGGSSLYGTLYLRDLAAKLDTGIFNHTSIGTPRTADLSDNGLVAYIADDGVYKYQNGSSTKISSAYATAVRTDGLNVIYKTSTRDNSPKDTLYLNGNDTIISAVTSGSDIAINHGFITYTRSNDTLGQKNVWRRDPSGNNSQLSFWGANQNHDLGVKALNESGDAMLYNNGSTVSQRGFFYAGHNGQLKRITNYSSNAASKDVFSENGSWYILLGNTVFKVNPDTTIQVNITSFAKEGTLNNPIAFTASDFTDHFSGPASGPGQLIDIQISSFPKHGKLLLGQDVLSPGFSTIARNKLGLLSYQPDEQYLGTDTIRWKAGNGLEYSANDAAISILTGVEPIVSLASNVRVITSLADTVVITATNIAGGGNTPLYTFAKDSLFTDILQAASTSNQLKRLPALFSIGANVIYARMRTSESYYIDSIAVDSIHITRSPVTAIVDVDHPGKTIGAYPNPFTQQFTLDGLQASNTYTLTLYDIQGKLILQRKVYNQTKVNVLNASDNLEKGTYLLRIFNDKKKRLVGTLKIVHQ